MTEENKVFLIYDRLSCSKYEMLIEYCLNVTLIPQRTAIFKFTYIADGNIPNVTVIYPQMIRRQADEKGRRVGQNVV